MDRSPKADKIVFLDDYKSEGAFLNANKETLLSFNTPGYEIHGSEAHEFIVKFTIIMAFLFVVMFSLSTSTLEL